MPSAGRAGEVAATDAVPAAVAVGAAGPTATTAHGLVRGAVEGGVLAFRGVRYGADTSTTCFAASASPRVIDDARGAQRALFQDKGACGRRYQP